MGEISREQQAKALADELVNEVIDCLAAPSAMATCRKAAKMLRALSAEQPAKEAVEVRLSDMHESNGRVTWVVSLARQDTSPFDALQVYASEIKGALNMKRTGCVTSSDSAMSSDLLSYNTEALHSADPRPECEWLKLEDARSSERRVGQRRVRDGYLQHRVKGDYGSYRIDADRRKPTERRTGEPDFRANFRDERRATERAAQQDTAYSGQPESIRQATESIAPAVAALPQEEGDVAGTIGTLPEPVLSIRLDEDQAAELYAFLSMFNDKDFAPLSVHIGNGHSGTGLYVSMSEYPDEGATFIAPLSPLAAAPQEAAPKECVWMIFYDDQDKKPEIHTSEAAARHRYAEISMSWNAHLFAKVDSNSRDDIYAKANRAAPQAPREAQAVDEEMAAWLEQLPDVAGYPKFPGVNRIAARLRELSARPAPEGWVSVPREQFMLQLARIRGLAGFLEANNSINNAATAYQVVSELEAMLLPATPEPREPRKEKP